jgi:hypothetical protein
MEEGKSLERHDFLWLESGGKAAGIRLAIFSVPEGFGASPAPGP